jgi:hypothetical protein
MSYSEEGGYYPPAKAKRDEGATAPKKAAKDYPFKLDPF